MSRLYVVTLLFLPKKFVVVKQEMMLMCLCCLELQLEQKSLMKGKNSKTHCHSNILLAFTCRCFSQITKLNLKQTCLLSLVSQRKSTSGSGRDCGDVNGLEARFQSDVFLLTMASSQRDLFENDWISFAVRVHWLKARHLAFQVKNVCGKATIGMYIFAVK